MTIEPRHTEFRLRLQELMKDKGPFARPFLCEGSPLDRPIVIVGINSARELKRSFWDYWNDSYGFKKTEFLRDLCQLSGGLTKTRKKIEAIAKAVGQKHVLDMNFYLSPTARAKDMMDKDKLTDVFEFLLQEIRPHVVLAHGKKDTCKFFSSRSADFVWDSEQIRDVTAKGIEFRLLCSKHLWLPAVDPTKIVRILKEALEQR